MKNIFRALSKSIPLFKKMVFGTAVFALALSGVPTSFIFAEDGCDITVGSEGVIMDALGDAIEGDTVCVEAGEYAEDISVNTNGVHLKTIDGLHTVTLEGLVTIHANDVVFDGFKIRDFEDRIAGGGDPVVEISGENVTIQDLDIFTANENLSGNVPMGIIVLSSASGTQVISNTVDSDFDTGHVSIGSWGANNVEITNNTVRHAIGADAGDLLVISGNTVARGYDEGIWINGVASETQLVIENNTVEEYSVGNPDKKALKIVNEPETINDEDALEIQIYSTILGDNSGVASMELGWIGPVYNQDAETSHGSIQEAIDAAEEGETIQVTPGTYEEEIDINKTGLTLVSTDGAASTIIRSATTREEGVVAIVADGTTLDGFTVDNEDGPRAVRINDATGTTTITNNILTNSLRGIQGNWASGGVDITIVGNTIQTEYGVAGTEDMKALTIEENIFNTTAEGVGIGEGVEITSIANNTFAGSGEHVRDYRDPFDASLLEGILADNTFDTAVVVRVNPVIAPVIFSSIQDGIDETRNICQAGQVNMNTASAEELVDIIHIGETRAQEIVDDHQPNFDSLNDLVNVNGIGEATLEDIKNQGLACVDVYGIGEVSEVYVAASSGVYEENLEIAHSVQLIGPNAGSDPNTDTRAGEAVIKPAEGTAVEAVNNDLSVTIDGFTIDGEGADHILKNASNIDWVIDNNIFSNTPNAGATGALDFQETPLGSLGFSGNLVAPGDGNFIRTYSDGDAVDVTIVNNVFEEGNQPLHLSRPIGEIIGNHFDGNTQGMTIDTHNEGELRIEQNVFNGAGRGFELHTSRGGIVIIEDNEIKGSGSDYEGLLVRNNIENGGIASTTVEKNSFSENEGFAINNESENILEAPNNWWGDVTGPSREGIGNGDAVSEYVNYEPWLLAPDGYLFEETATNTATSSITITWTTEKPATSRVIWDTESHSAFATSTCTSPDSTGFECYGYASTTNLFDEKVTSHSVTIEGLNPDTTYYYRAVSSASPEVLGEEGSTTTASEEELEENEEEKSPSAEEEETEEETENGGGPPVGTYGVVNQNPQPQQNSQPGSSDGTVVEANGGENDVTQTDSANDGPGTSPVDDSETSGGLAFETTGAPAAGEADSDTQEDVTEENTEEEEEGENQTASAAAAGASDIPSGGMSAWLWFLIFALILAGIGGYTRLYPAKKK